MKRLMILPVLRVASGSISRSVLAGSAPATAPTPAPAAVLQRMDGFLPLSWDEKNGKLMLEISRFGEEMIYQVSLPAGVGSNPLGLDRGELGQTHIIRFDRVGPRVLMVEPNYKYRAITSDPAERHAVEDSFAQSILAGFKVGSIPASACSAWRSTTTPVRSPDRSRRGGSHVIVWKRRTRMRRSPSRSGRSSITWTTVRRNRSAARSSKGLRGGTPHSRPRDFATRFRSRSYPRTPIRWTSATT